MKIKELTDFVKNAELIHKCKFYSVTAGQQV